MNTKLTVWIIVGILGVIVIGVLWHFLSASETAPTTQQEPVSLPSSGSVVVPISPPTSPQPGEATISLTAEGGNTILAKDFVHNGVTVTDHSNPGNYIITGASALGFSIGYHSAGQFFTIALDKEPLGETRVVAENFLLEALGISKTQMCNLKYYLGTDVHTNSFYGGKSLGFSFCPGATVLPK